MIVHVDVGSSRQEHMEEILDSARESVQARIWAGRTRRSAYVEDAEDDDDNNTQLPAQGGSCGSESGSSDYSDSESSEDDNAWYEEEAYCSHTMLSEEFLRRARLHGMYGLMATYLGQSS